MNSFTFSQPTSAADAIATIAQSGGARFIAGGTNILDLMKDGVEEPPLLIDINALPLRAIEHLGDRLRIGALARMSDIASDPNVRAAFPLVATALEQSASPQLRNMASIGGNILQRTRCPYFRDTATPCNKRLPGSGCSAIHGINHMQAILGTSDDCIATHASDVAVTFAALGATIDVDGPTGQREIAFADFYRMPGSMPHIETTLQHGELITSVSLPFSPTTARSVYVKVRDRAQYEFALASAAVVLGTDAGIVRYARIALGGVGTVPWRSAEAERTLLNAPNNRAQFEQAAKVALTGAHGFGDNDYKIELARRTLVRALETVGNA